VLSHLRSRISQLKPRPSDLAEALHFSGAGATTAAWVRRADCLLEPWWPPVSPFSFWFSSSLQSLERWVWRRARQALDHFAGRERLTLTAWLPARLGLRLLPQAKIAFGEK
jgi:hypothetical protein